MAKSRNKMLKRDSQGRPLYQEGEQLEAAVAATGRRLEHLWKPGQSGNPRGRRTPILSRAIRETLSEPCPECPELTNAEAIALALTKKARNGDIQAIALLADRSEGKAPATLNIAVGLAQRFEQLNSEQLLSYAENGVLPEPEPPPALTSATVQGSTIVDAEFVETSAPVDQTLMQKLREEARRKAPVIETEANENVQ